MSLLENSALGETLGVEKYYSLTELERNSNYPFLFMRRENLMNNQVISLPFFVLDIPSPLYVDNLRLLAAFQITSSSLSQKGDHLPPTLGQLFPTPKGLGQ